MMETPGPQRSPQAHRLPLPSAHQGAYRARHCHREPRSGRHLRHVHPWAPTLWTHHLPLFPHRGHAHPLPCVPYPDPAATPSQPRPQPRGPGTRGCRAPAPHAGARGRPRRPGPACQRVRASAARGGGQRPPPRSGALDWLSTSGPAPVTPQAPPTLKAPSWVLGEDGNPGDGQLCPGCPLLQGILHTGDLVSGDRQSRSLRGSPSPEPQQPCMQEELRGSGVIRSGGPLHLLSPHCQASPDGLPHASFVLNWGLM